MCEEITCTLERVADLVRIVCANKFDAFWHIGYVSDCEQAERLYKYHYTDGDSGVYTNLIF